MKTPEELKDEAVEIVRRGITDMSPVEFALAEIVPLLTARDERDELKKETCECRWDNTGGQTIECKSHAKLRAELERVKGEAETWASRASQYVSDEQKYGTHKELADQLAALTDAIRGVFRIREAVLRHRISAGSSRDDSQRRSVPH